MPNEEEYQKWYDITVRQLFQDTSDRLTCKEFRRVLRNMGMPEWWPSEFAKREHFEL